MIYVLDTNAVSDFLKKQPTVTNSIIKAQRQQERIIITPPVHYEIMRGLVRHRATTQLTRLNTQILPLFEWGEITDADWAQAAELWASAVRRGKQLSDVDLLLAAVTQRLEATLVSSDADFDALPIQRVNWREEQPS